MDTPAVDDLLERALAPNTQKFALNFWVEDLRAEHERLKALDLSDTLGGIKYVCFTQPYFYFDLTDPDGNVIEVTGAFTSAAGTFSDGGVS